MKKTFSFFLLFLITAGIAVGQDGIADDSFGSSGIATMDYPGGNIVSKALAFQSDGKIIICGYLDFEITHCVLARFNDDGSPDPSFGVNGLVITAIEESGDCVLISGDEKIIITCLSALYGFNSDGTPDEAFGDGGKVSLNIYANAAVIQSDGKIIVSGYTESDGNRNFGLERYHANGDLDTSFGEEGIVITVLSEGDHDQINDIVMQTDNKILVAGTVRVGIAWDFTVARYTANGQADSSFNSTGTVIFSIGLNDECVSINLQPDNKIVLAGYTNDGDADDFALARYLADGTPDNAFGSDGITRTDVDSGSPDAAYSSTIQADGKIILAGFSYDTDTDDRNVLLCRYTENGLPDSTFGSNGIVFTEVGLDDEAVYQVKMDAQQRIVATGYYQKSLDNAIFLARYLSDDIADNIENSIFQQEISVYPNPASEKTMITYSLQSDVLLTMELYGPDGKKMQTFFTNKLKRTGHNEDVLLFDKDFAAGNYIVKLSSTGYNQYTRFIIIK